MDTTLRDKAEYIVIVVNEFARKHALTELQAYRYLNRCKAIDFLDDHYDVAHTQTFESVVDGITLFCQRRGGAIS